MKSTTKSIKIPEDLLTDVKQIALDEFRSFSSVVKSAIKEYIDARKKK